MIKNRIVVREKSTNKNRMFVFFIYDLLYTFKKLFDIIKTIIKTGCRKKEDILY